LVLATVPAALLWLWCGEWVDEALSEPRAQLVVLAAMLAVTGVVLLSTRRARRSDDDEVTVRQAWWMGWAQALAIVPGISRSGGTIAVARHLGVQPGRAAEFSFLMSLPVVLGGVVIDWWRDAPPSAGGDVLSVYHYVAGALIAAAVGYLVIGRLIRFLCRGHYWVFGVYCLALSAVLLGCRWCGAV